ncbi:AAA family ATPase [Yersinia enterocolitica]
MKFKKVEIEGFRAYKNKSDGTFDFTLPNGQPANLISIYAPNGFGKTSFYDAVEWAITKNIGRYIREAFKTQNNALSLALNDSSKPLNILRNRDIGSDDISQVTVETTGELFTQKVGKAIKGRRDYKFDPKETIQENKSFNDVFLSQEAIDSFLKEEKPEMRYEKFMSDFGGEDEIYRKKIIALLKQNESSLKLTHRSIETITEFLKVPINEDVFNTVNDTIVSLNNYNESFEKIDNIFDRKQELELKNKITKRLHEIEYSSDEINIQLVAINYCIVNFDLFLKSLNSNKINKENLDKLIKYKAIIENKDKLKISISKNEAMQNEFFMQNEENDLFIDFLSEYIKYRDRLIYLDLELKHQERIKNGYDLTFNTIAAKENDTILELTSIENNINTIISKQLAVESIYDDIHQNEKIINDVNNDLTRLNNELLVQKQRITLIDNDISAISDINLEIESFSNPSISLLEIGDGVMPRAMELVLSRNALVSKNVDLEHKHAVLRVQATDIAKLVELGAKILNSTSAKICPLCEHEYSSFKEVSDRILNNSSLTDIENSIVDQKNKLLFQINENENEIISTIEKIRNSKELKIDTLNKEKINTIKRIGSLTSDVLEKNTDLVFTKSKLLSLTSTVNEMPKEQFYLSLNKRLTELEKLKVSLPIALNETISEKNEYEEKRVNIGREITKIKSEIDTINNFYNYKKTCIKLNNEMIPTNSEADFFNGIRKDINNKLLNIRDEINNAKLSLNNYDNDLLALNLNLPLNMVDSEMKKIDIALMQGNLDVVGYLNEFKKTKIEIIESLISHNDSVLLLNERKELLNSHLSISSKIASLLKLLSLHVNELLPYLDYISKKDECAKFNVEAIRQENLSRELYNEYGLVINRLNKRIKGFFYSDLINNIYKKIDPHPNFKIVDFNCVFPENEKPRLEVLLSDKDGTVISPNLYFSAAQLNILSLSIFLAKALHAKHKEEPIESIFIDDPIHSMDSINILSTIDLLRNISTIFGRQIIISTHNYNFHELLKKKLPPEIFGSKFIYLESFGKVAPH